MLLSFIIKYYNVDVKNAIGYNFSENSNVPVYIFMSVIVAIFIGLTVSAEEIIKDRKILKREQFLNLSWASFLLSKVCILFALSALQAIMFVSIGNTIMEIKGMYWQYWLVLFSAWCFSNLTGLIISDSFKTAVTIYILIPFLVIPQIILSGVMVKFDKLNPDISSPNNIPFYGEIITARWAYEAIAVYQFKENKYERQFYPYDKVASISNYKKDYWLVELKNKVDETKRELNNPAKRQTLVNNLELLRNEISEELVSNRNFKFNQIKLLYIDKVTPQVLDMAKKYLTDLTQYYIQKFKKASSYADKIKTSQQRNDKEKEQFIDLKRKHYNENLDDFVTNKNELASIVEYENHLYQKVDPIFHDPSSGFIKAHFYAPRKKLFGRFMDTFWVNIIVIWFMTLISYLVLYFRGLKRFLDFAEEVSERLVSGRKGKVKGSKKKGKARDKDKTKRREHK
jgi:ABC transport system ATP-binding/permease protein